MFIYLSRLSYGRSSAYKIGLKGSDRSDRIRWERHKFNIKLVNPANKRKHTIFVVGTGLAGASAAASMAELGYKVKPFVFTTHPAGPLHRGAGRDQRR